MIAINASDERWLVLAAFSYHHCEDPVCSDGRLKYSLSWCVSLCLDHRSSTLWILSAAAAAAPPLLKKTTSRFSEFFKSQYLETTLDKYNFFSCDFLRVFQSWQSVLHKKTCDSEILTFILQLMFPHVILLLFGSYLCASHQTFIITTLKPNQHYNVLDFN